MASSGPTVTILSQTRAVAVVQGFSISVTDGPNAGKVWHSAPHEEPDAPASSCCSVGTDPRNDLVLKDWAVSRFHCEVQSDALGLRVLDQPSKNGTFVNGVRVRDAYLERGSQLQLGRTTLRVEIPGEAHPIPLSDATRFGLMAGESIAMRSVFSDLALAARRDVGVLIQGESGTGKELAAKSIRMYDPRRKDGPFQIVDCGLLVGNLFETELFGNTRGAFTGALERKGVFEVADGGIVFLDEIGNVPLEKQASLLRVLQEKEVRPVGSNTFRRVDVRIIAATNSDLRGAVNSGTFRADLYYRLAVVRVQLPPLRERPEDIPLLTDTLLEDLGASAAERAALLGERSFMPALQQHVWAGNIRELRNYLERCLTFERRLPIGDEPSPAPEHAPAWLAACDPTRRYADAKRTALLVWEKRYLDALLAVHGGNVPKAAEAVGLSRAYLYRLLQLHGNDGEPSRNGR